MGLGMQILDPHHGPQLDHYFTSLIIFWSCNHMEYLQLKIFLPAFWSSMSENLLDTVHKMNFGECEETARWHQEHFVFRRSRFCSATPGNEHLNSSKCCAWNG